MFDAGFQTFTIMSLKVFAKWWKDPNEMVLMFRKSKSEALLVQALTWQHHFHSGFAVIKPDKNIDITNA